MAKGVGLKILWLRPPWVRIPPPAPSAAHTQPIFEMYDEVFKMSASTCTDTGG